MRLFNFLRRQSRTALAGLVWAGLIALGLHLLWKHELTAGDGGHPVASWPSGTSLSHDDQLPTLIVFAHALCPCTRATLDELSVIMTRCQGKVRADVVLYEPADSADGTGAESLRWKALQIPGVRVLNDEQRHEAERFGARTSGHAFLYDSRGELLFQGGITGSRGHSGANSGRTSIIELIHNPHTGMDHTPVFGCGLSDESGNRRSDAEGI